MNPIPLLAIAVALFVAPAISILSASLLSQQGHLRAGTLAGQSESVFWAFGIAALLAPFAIPRLLRTSDRASQLLFILTVNAIAPAFGQLIAFTTGRLISVQVFGVASMLAILGWCWAYRDGFRAQPLEYVTPRYTAQLLFLGAVSLAFAGFRVAFWDHVANSSTRSAASGFMIFVDATVGVAAFATARWRKQGSAYARSATEVLSWALLVIPVLGTLTSLYWIFAVRNQERLARRAA